MVKSSSNSSKNKYISFKASPQPKDIIFKKLKLTKNKSKKNNGINSISSKSSKRNIFSKLFLKGSTNQNAIKKNILD